MIKLTDILKEYNITSPSSFPTKDDMIELINGAYVFGVGITYLYITSLSKLNDVADKLGRDEYGDEWNNFEAEDKEANIIFYKASEQLAEQLKEYLSKMNIKSEIMDDHSDYGGVIYSLLEISTSDFNRLKEKFKK